MNPLLRQVVRKALQRADITDWAPVRHQLRLEGGLWAAYTLYVTTSRNGCEVTSE